MKHQVQWLALVIALVGGIAGSLGCATMAASGIVNSGDNDFYNTPVISDEIVAIGKPDVSLGKALGQEHVVAFIGLKNTYLLYNGGEELERVAQLKLDGNHMTVDASWNRQLYVKDKQVWGDVQLRYGNGNGTMSAEELSELNKGGFTAVGSGKFVSYQKQVSIGGVIYPPIKIPDEQLSRLGVRRPIRLYHSRDEKPPMLPKILKAPLIPLGIAVDTAVSPIFGVIGLVFAIEVVAN
jgi:hypothetical protein